MNLNTVKLDIIDSTSTYAKENAASLPLPSLITARGQTDGRGRTGKKFYSPEGTGLYMTLLTEAPSGFDLITPAAAVCVCEALEELLSVKLDIKWVNDIFLNGRKVCGILTEKFICEGRALISIGIGINLTTQAFPPDIPQAGSLGAQIDPQALAESISARILETLEKTDIEKILASYRERMFILGREISFRINGKEMTGVASDINESGNLEVKTDGGTITLSSGEISIGIR